MTLSSVSLLSSSAKFLDSLTTVPSCSSSNDVRFPICCGSSSIKEKHRKHLSCLNRVTLCGNSSMLLSVKSSICKYLRPPISVGRLRMFMPRVPRYLRWHSHARFFRPSEEPSSFAVTTSQPSKERTRKERKLVGLLIRHPVPLNDLTFGSHILVRSCFPRALFWTATIRALF